MGGTSAGLKRPPRQNFARQSLPTRCCTSRDPPQSTSRGSLARSAASTRVHAAAESSIRSALEAILRLPQAAHPAPQPICDLPTAK